MTATVLQCDREAAAAITARLCEWLRAKGIAADYIASGGDDEMVQAFARHRHDSTREMAEAANRCIKIIERNLYHQHEKLEDVPIILRKALSTLQGTDHV